MTDDLKREADTTDPTREYLARHFAYAASDWTDPTIAALVKIMQEPRMHTNMSGDREWAIVEAILASGLVVTTAEADARVADMRERAAKIGEKFDNPAKDCGGGCCNPSIAIRALPIANETETP